MKKVVLILFFGCCLVSATGQKVNKVKIGELVEYISKSDHPLVINFWATWCAPCTRELPYFQSGVKQYADKNVELILVSLDFNNDYPKKVTAFLKQNKYEGTFYWLNETDADHFCPKVDPKWDGAIPASLFLNAKTGYRSFYQRQLTDRQLEVELKKLVE